LATFIKKDTLQDINLVKAFI